MTVDFLYNEGPRGLLGLGRLNLGDLLCSPETYFDIESDKRTLVIGGGIQGGFITGKNRIPAGYDKVCVWAGGLSKKPDVPIGKQIDGIDIWTIRDKECAPDAQNWLPCVSCMHPMLDHPDVESQPQNSLLYINADPVIYSPSTLMKSRSIALDAGFDFCTNRAGQDDFFKKWHKCGHVVTNSYHGAYWSLLAGKKVSIFGYNYKFESLVSMLELNSPVITFTKRNRGSLLEATRSVILSRNALCLKDADKTLKSFREMQVDFAAALCRKGIISSFSQIDQAEVHHHPLAGESEMRRILTEYLGAADRRLNRYFRLN